MKYVKLLYKPSNKIVPMLMFYSNPDIKVYNQNFLETFGTWNNEDKSIWNINAYVLYNDIKITSYKFNDITYLVWLLRLINKDLVIDVRECYLNEIQKNYHNEFIELK